MKTDFYSYAFFDGDNVGNTIEILLIEGRISDAQILSKNINEAIRKISESFNDKVEIIIAGEDDILLKIKEDKEMIKNVYSMVNMFNDITGLTMSCGVSESIEGAIYQLSIAKLYGKNQVKISEKKV